jgi:ribose transport system permease protein
MNETTSTTVPSEGSVRRFRPPQIEWRSLGIIYVLAFVVVVFAIWIPDRFLAYDTLASVLNSSAIACLVALALVLPLSAGLFDFSIGYTVGLTGVLAAYLLGPAGMSVFPAVALSVLGGVAIGTFNGLVVVRFKVDSFIGTLATGSLLFALILLVSGDQILTDGVNEKAFANIAQANWHQLNLPVAYALVVAVVLWLLLSHTPTGRFFHATGLSTEAARLAGIRTNVLCFVALIVSALLAGCAGIVNTAQIGAGSPQVGPEFLIPAYAAAFLGRTQSSKGLFSVWGTVAAVLLLQTTTTGLSLTGAPIWAPYVVTGIVLIASIGIANATGGLSRWRAS